MPWLLNRSPSNFARMVFLFATCMELSWSEPFHVSNSLIWHSLQFSFPTKLLSSIGSVEVKTSLTFSFVTGMYLELLSLQEYWIKERITSRYSKLSLIHISEPTRRTPISYAVFCLKKKK